jgi:hypothetical protein
MDCKSLAPRCFSNHDAEGGDYQVYLWREFSRPAVTFSQTRSNVDLQYSHKPYGALNRIPAGTAFGDMLPIR